MSLDLNTLTNDEIRLLDLGYEKVFEYLFARGRRRGEKTDMEILNMGFSKSFVTCYRSMEGVVRSKRNARLARKLARKDAINEAAKVIAGELDRARGY